MFTLDDLVLNDTITYEMSEFIKICMKSDINLLCIGVSGSGRNTFLNAVKSLEFDCVEPELVDINNDNEFYQLNMMLKDEKRIFATWHSDNEIDASFRYSLALLNKVYDTVNDCVSDLINYFPIVVRICKLVDGRRRVTNISELIGVTEDDRVVSNVLFEFKFTGDVIRDDIGKVTDVVGTFQQVNSISERLAQYFKNHGVVVKELNMYI